MARLSSMLNWIVTRRDQRLIFLSIIAVPAIGADPKETWRFTTGHSKASRIRRSLSGGPGHGDASPNFGPSVFDKVDSARVYFYTHPQLRTHEQREISYFARALLHQVIGFPDLGDRPICFAGHSTGGLVVKQALITASMHTENKRMTSIVRRCFGVSFFGTPRKKNVLMWRCSD